MVVGEPYRLPPVSREMAMPDLSRRRVVFAGLSGLQFFSFSRASGEITKTFRKEKTTGRLESRQWVKLGPKTGPC